jgi:riboflavin synthase
VPAGFSRYVVPKGSIALDGISLTVAGRGPRTFDVAIVPETRRRTTLSAARPGTRLNFEADLFARYGARGWRRLVSLPRRRT